MKNTLKQFGILLQPSWLSGLAAGTASAAVVIATVVISNYQGSGLQHELFAAKAGGSTASALGFRTVTDNLAHNSAVSNLPLLLFWAVLGVIVYLFAVHLWGVFGRAEALREELGYVNAPKQYLLRTALSRLALRLLFLAVWLVYLQLFLKLFLPYALAAAHVAAAGWSASNTAYGVLAAAVLSAALHAHVVCARLVLLKLRVFGSQPIEP